MSDKEYKFADTNPENQKPHNISGQNPRSVQTLHKSQVKPKSQDKDINIEFVENEATVYKTKTTYLVQKAKMQLKRRVAPGVSEIIIRKNEEKRKLAEEKAQKEAEAKAEEEKVAAVESEVEVQEEIESQEEVQTEPETSEEPVEEPVEEPISEETETAEEATNNGKSFTQTLREQGLIYGQKVVEAVEKAKPEIEATIQDAKKIVDIEAEKAKSEPSSEGKSFTQTLREQGFIEGQKIIQAIEKAKPEIEATIQEAKTAVEKVVEEASKPKEEANQAETPKQETTTDGKSFTQTLREQGFIQTETATTETPKQETVETKEETVEEVTEEKVVEDKKEDNSSNGEVKTFIDLIRSEGLL